MMLSWLSGENHGHEEVVFFLAGMVGVVFLLFLTHQSGGGAAVMTVGDIHGRNVFLEQFHQFGNDGLVVNHPETVAEAVFLGYEIVEGLLCGDAGHDFIDALHGGVGEEHGFHVGVGDTHVFHTVFFLILAGKLVFLDDFVHVVFAGGAGHDTVLPFLEVHALGIDVELFFLVLHQPAVVLELVVVVHHLQIHFGRMFVGALGQVNFGLGYMKQAVGIAFAFLTGFFRVKHVVGTARQFFYNVNGRPEAFERFDDRHDVMF